MTDEIIAIRAYRLKGLGKKEGAIAGETIGSAGDRFLKARVLEAYQNDKQILM